jgi:hypothetical protein
MGAMFSKMAAGGLLMLPFSKLAQMCTSLMIRIQFEWDQCGFFLSLQMVIYLFIIKKNTSSRTYLW